MLRIFGYVGMAASFMAVLTLAGAPNAFAQNKPTNNKPTYEQAWAACAKDVKSNFPNEYSATNQRYPRFRDCVMGHGYPAP
jgi:hypothetical protein